MISLIISWFWIIPLAIFLSKTFPNLHASIYFGIGALGYLITDYLLK
jgi:hypothetical protein